MTNSVLGLSIDEYIKSKEIKMENNHADTCCKSGETIYSIAQLYDVSADRIVYDNELAAQQNLVPGQALLILMTSQVHIVREGQTVSRSRKNIVSRSKIYIKTIRFC